MKLLSIAVPCYNSQDYMEKCIESLLIGGDEVEILIINDGSTDNTAQIADDYARRYPGIVRAIHKENGGHGSAVNTGIQEASGLYFKVVDSDDWLRDIAFRKVLMTLQELAGGEQRLDMMISNFVYDKDGAEKKKVMRYTRYMPVEEMFSWKDIKKFPKGKYILMHSVIFRTKLLKECGMHLPEHTFYVDNIYVFEPLPFVNHMYYLDVNLYHYYIGRDDQSVHEDVMISRIDQQIKVNKLMVDYYSDNYGMIASSPRRKQYMFNYLEVITMISSVMLILSKTTENLQKKEELWTYIKKKNYPLYLKMRYAGMGNLVYLPGKGGRSITIGGYKLVRRVYKFN